MTYNEGILKLADIYADEFEVKGKEYLKSIVNLKSIRETLIALEKIMINKGECTRIEDLRHEEKLDLWNTAKELCPGANTETTMDVCRALNGFGSYIKYKDEN